MSGKTTPPSWVRLMIAVPVMFLFSSLAVFVHSAEGAGVSPKWSAIDRQNTLAQIGDAKAKLPRGPEAEPEVLPAIDVDGQGESPDLASGDPGPSIVVPPSALIARLPMDDQYHSQLTETHRPNACGPTSLLMVLDYFELEDSLAAVIAEHQFSPAQGGYDPSCTANPVCTSPGALVRVARERYGLTVVAREGWTFEEIRQSLADGQPVIADIVWRLADEGPGHFVVIFGIDMVERTITYHDPYDGGNKTSSWDDFAAAWDGPVDRGDPLQPEGHRFWGMSIGIE